jgi:hypothetical protein
MSQSITLSSKRLLKKPKRARILQAVLEVAETVFLIEENKNIKTKCFRAYG